MTWLARSLTVTAGGARVRAAAWAALAALAGCGGGRTVLLSADEACARFGHERTCSNACGEGTQLCVAGIWRPCMVPLASRPCANACGAGVATCRDGSWGACGVPVVTETCTSLCGVGERVCQNGTWLECDAAQPAAARLRATLRDFHDTHPDFERPGTGDLSDPGIVLPLLGSDDTPTYAHSGGTLTVTSPASFADWYHDVPGVNVAIPYEIPLTPAADRPGSFEFLSTDFFPLDGDARAFGNEGQAHDFDFTLATKFTFHYLGGELFRFTGDDDLWVFINRHLAIDLGGLHQSKTGQVYLDERAAELGITLGNTYDLHLFFAERHVINSDFSIETTITDPGRCE